MHLTDVDVLTWTVAISFVSISIPLNRIAKAAELFAKSHAEALRNITEERKPK